MANYQNYPAKTYRDLRELYSTSAKEFGGRTAFLVKNGEEIKEITYRAFADDVDALGTVLADDGLAGEKILILGENEYEWAVTYFAAACLGVAVPLDFDASAEEIANIATLCGAKAIVYSEKAEEKILGLGSGMKRYRFDGLRPLMARAGTLAESREEFTGHEIDPDALCVLLFTSGSTGAAKGVMLSHHNICFNLSELSQMIRVRQDDVFLSVLPIHHAYETTCGMLFPLCFGAAIAYAGGLRGMTRAMQEIRPTIMLCVPLLMETMYRKIENQIRSKGLERKVRGYIKMTNSIATEKLRIAAKRRIFSGVHKNFGGRLRALISGGAAISPDVLAGFRNFGIAAYQGYGLTECAPIAAMNRDRFFNDNSAGMATPNTLIDIYDVQDDGTGEVRFKGENTMLGYFGEPELTEEVLRNGWLYTGDLGYMDKDGFLYITGRKKNVIVKSNGKNIYPEELEVLLDASDAIRESVIVGYVNHRKKDYDVVAIVVPDREKMAELFGADYTEEDLDTQIKRAVAETNAAVQPYKRIDAFVLREEEFPKNTSRKIKREGLAEEAHEAYLEKIAQKAE